MARDTDFKHESVQDRQSIVNYLNVLADGFEEGRLLFGKEKRQVALKPNGLLDFEDKWCRKGVDVRLSLKVGWRNERPDDQEAPGPLVIEPA